VLKVLYVEMLFSIFLVATVTLNKDKLHST